MVWENKVVWVTGASSGIGEAIASELLKEGAKVVISARRVELLNKIAAKAENASKVLIIPLDLKDHSKFEEYATRVVDHFDGIDVLINNGGISQRSEAMETSEATERLIMEIDFFGQVALAKAVIPYMRSQERGSIAVISSLSGKFGFYLRSSYAAAKHALHGYFESLRLEEEPNGINVIMICPGLIKTNISINALDARGISQNTMDQKQESGMDPKLCAVKILEAIESNKLEAIIGGRERWAVVLKRWFPKLFHRRIKGESPR